MTRAMTPEAAAEKVCPIARLFPSAHVEANCRAAACMMWRWEPLSTADPAWRAAVRSIADEAGEKAPFPKAARAVAENPEAHGLSAQTGFCGLAGRPIA